MQQEVILKVNMQDLALIGDALAELPFKQVQQLIGKLSAQVQSQQQEQATPVVQ